MGHRPGFCAWLAAGLLTPLVLLADPGSRFTVPQQDEHTTAVDQASLALSADGRLLAFASYASLVAADTHPGADVYVLDVATGLITLESLTGAGDPSLFLGVRGPHITSDGRFVVFQDMMAFRDGVYHGPVLKDRKTGAVAPLAAGLGGEPADGASCFGEISANGRVVVFVSGATNLVAGPDANGKGADVYVLDVASGRIDRAGIGNDGTQPATGASYAPAVSADGRHVAFVSIAPLDSDTTLKPTALLHAGEARRSDIYVRDLEGRTTRRVTVSHHGGEPDGASSWPALSGDGRFVAFVSEATNLVAGDRNRVADVFVRDMRTGATTLVSRRTGGGSANGPSAHPAISADGRFVVFQSQASDLVCARGCGPEDEDINLVWDVFLFDRETGITIRLSGDGDAPWMEPSVGPAIDGTGRVVAFSSYHPTGPDDRVHDLDAFVLVRELSPSSR